MASKPHECQYPSKSKTSVLPSEEEEGKGGWILEKEPTASSRMIHLGQASEGNLYGERALEAGYETVRHGKGREGEPLAERRTGQDQEVRHAKAVRTD